MKSERAASNETTFCRATADGVSLRAPRTGHGVSATRPRAQVRSGRRGRRAGAARASAQRRGGRRRLRPSRRSTPAGWRPSPAWRPGAGAVRSAAVGGVTLGHEHPGKDAGAEPPVAAYDRNHRPAHLRRRRSEARPHTRRRARCGQHARGARRRRRGDAASRREAKQRALRDANVVEQLAQHVDLGLERELALPSAALREAGPAAVIAAAPCAARPAPGRSFGTTGPPSWLPDR
jgi:hypothetical protein